jgi:FkbH-like protein
LQEHPEMVLRPSDFAGWRINWNDKAQNIADLVAELNLGLDAVVFIDDNPVERARVRDALPDVLVPEWPADQRLYPAALLALDCFGASSVTQEDRERVASYSVERQRRALKLAGSVDDWLRSLDVEVAAEPISDLNRARALQLLNKTNQMNLATRRFSEPELVAWIDATGSALWTFRVRDKFGDSGLTGLASLSLRGTDAEIVDFVLSCRVMGRQVEETMIHVLAAFARDAGAERLVAQYRPTAKNMPCLEFFRRSGFAEVEPHLFVWRLARDYPPAAHIHLLAHAITAAG